MRFRCPCTWCGASCGLRRPGFERKCRDDASRELLGAHGGDLAEHESIVWKLTLPVPPDFHAARFKSRRVICAAVTAIEGSQRLARARELDCMPQVVLRIRLERHDLIEQ